MVGGASLNKAPRMPRGCLRCKICVAFTPQMPNAVLGYAMRFIEKFLRKLQALLKRQLGL